MVDLNCSYLHALLKEKGKGKYDKDRHEAATGPRMQSTECRTAASHSWKLLSARSEDCRRNLQERPVSSHTLTLSFWFPKP